MPIIGTFWGMQVLLGNYSEILYDSPCDNSNLNMLDMYVA
jgi:hypothetical protein